MVLAHLCCGDLLYYLLTIFQRNKRIVLQFEYRISEGNQFIHELNSFVKKLQLSSDPNSSSCYNVLQKFKPSDLFAQTMKDQKNRDPSIPAKTKLPLNFIFSMRRIARNLMRNIVNDLQRVGLFDKTQSIGRPGLMNLMRYLCPSMQDDVEDFIISQLIPDLPKDNCHETCELGQCKYQSWMIFLSLTRSL